MPVTRACRSRITPHKQHRFEDAFGSRSVALLNIRGIVFVLLNSMAMEGDGCGMCMEAVQALKKVSEQLQCAKVSCHCAMLCSSVTIASYSTVLWNL